MCVVQHEDHAEQKVQPFRHAFPHLVMQFPPQNVPVKRLLFQIKLLPSTLIVAM